MELVSYLQLLRRWLWLILLAAALSGGAAFAVARSQPAIYQTSATMQVGAFQELANPDTRLIASAQGLAQTYFVLAKTRPFLEAVIARADLPFSPDALAQTFEMAIIPATPFFTITATHTNPSIAAQIVNTIADELVARTAPTGENRQNTIDLLQRQINDLTKRLDSDREELQIIEQRLKSAESPDPILVIRQDELIARINQQQRNLAEFQNSLITLQSQATLNVFTIIEAAQVPERSLGVSSVRDALLAAVLGAALSIGVIALLEQLNTTIKSAAEVTPLLKLPLLAALPAYGRKGSYRKRLVAWLNPRSPASEAFRALRVNLMFMRKDDNGRLAQAYVITSSRAGEGKSVTAANLAITFAQVGHQVVLIDADMRHPSQHAIFSLPNEAGLSDILGNEPPAPPKIVLEGDPTEDSTFFSNFKDTHETALLALSAQSSLPFYTIPDELPLRETAIPRLQVITAGVPPAHPADMLGSHKVRELVHHLMNKQSIEIVIIDTPPILEVADCGVLAGVIDAPVILVVEANRTRRSDAVAAVQRFAMLSVPVIGAILNRVRSSDEQTGYYGNSYSNGKSSYGQLPDKLP